MTIPNAKIPKTNVAILLNPVRKDKIKNITVSNIEQVFFNLFVFSVIFVFDILIVAVVKV